MRCAALARESHAGRAIAARNSRRLGLSLPVLDEPSLSREVVALACRIADAMIDLKRVRDERQDDADEKRKRFPTGLGKRIDKT